MFDNHRRDITIAMMKNYPQLLRKFMVDKEKVPFLVEIIVHMNLELYSLKRQEQVGVTTRLLNGIVSAAFDSIDVLSFNCTFRVSKIYLSL